MRNPFRRKSIADDWDAIVADMKDTHRQAVQEPPRPPVPAQMPPPRQPTSYTTRARTRTWSAGHGIDL